VTWPAVARAAALLAAFAAGTPAPGAAPGAAPPATRAAVSPNDAASGAAVPSGELRVRGADGRWRAWWREGGAPARWPGAHAPLAGLVAWRPAGPGVEVGELALSGAGEAWRVRAVLVRLDPARQRLALDADVDASGRVRPWGVARAPAAASVAFNAGMFGDAGPWGWVVHGGRELQAPGAGSLASAVVVGADGRVRVVGADSVPALRAAVGRGEVAEAVQGYPTLLDGDGAVPAALRPGADLGVDLEHRDARLLVGELRDGRVLVALTRFDALGAVSRRPVRPGAARPHGARGRGARRRARLPPRGAARRRAVGAAARARRRGAAGVGRAAARAVRHRRHAARDRGRGRGALTTAPRPGAARRPAAAPRPGRAARGRARPARTARRTRSDTRSGRPGVPGRPLRASTCC
jgi:hypothetical protein